MTSYINYDAQQARFDDMRRVASRRFDRHETQTTPPAEAATVRGAVAADTPALERLAALDSSRVPSGDLLIAEVSGQPRAAVAVTTGTAIADPFHPTAELVEHLRDRARHVRQADAHVSRVRRFALRLRSA